MSENSYESGFERQVLDRLTKIEAKLDNYDKLKETVYQNQRDIMDLKNRSDSQDKLIQTQLEQAEKKIAAIQDTNKWLARTIGATLIGIAIAVIVACIKVGIGG